MKKSDWQKDRQTIEWLAGWINGWMDSWKYGMNRPCRYIYETLKVPGKRGCMRQVEKGQRPKCFSFHWTWNIRQHDTFRQRNFCRKNINFLKLKLQWRLRGGGRWYLNIRQGEVKFTVFYLDVRLLPHAFSLIMSVYWITRFFEVIYILTPFAKYARG